MKPTAKTARLAATSLATVAMLTVAAGWFLEVRAARPPEPEVVPLPKVTPVNAAMVELGRHLFFDPRLSGDAAISCATCHDPKKGWGDGTSLSKAYPGSEYFRNSPSLLNVRHKQYLMWDGRLDGADLGTAVRDAVTEAHFMQADARLVQERLKQVPEYVAMWEKVFGKGADPYGPRMFNVVGEFLKTLTSRNVPFDRYLAGDQNAIGGDAKRGYAVFRGKAKCIACHYGPMLTDNRFHNMDVPEHPAVWNEPLRAITMLRHFATSGMPNYMNARTDLGRYAITKDERDRGRFLTPSLRELKYTAPYMHNGIFETLDEVVEFHNRHDKLDLTHAEKKALVAFLESLSGDPLVVEAPKPPDYKPRTFGKN